MERGDVQEIYWGQLAQGLKDHGVEVEVDSRESLTYFKQGKDALSIYLHVHINEEYTVEGQVRMQGDQLGDSWSCQCEWWW